MSSKHSNVTSFIKKSYRKKKTSTYQTKFRPNYFIGIQLSNPEIHQSIVDVQRDLLKFDEHIAPALIDVATLHITLLVFHIENEEKLNIACSALDKCGAILMDAISSYPITLSLQGLSHFNHQTLYAKFINDDHYKRLLDVVKEIKNVFDSMNVACVDSKDFTPHVTIAKLSKLPRNKAKTGLKRIDVDSWRDFHDYFFGTQEVVGIQILSMGKPKDSSRYYFKEKSVEFDFIASEESDHSKCCFPRRPSYSKLKKRSQSDSPISSDFILRAVIGGALIVSAAFLLSRTIKRNPT